MILFRTKCRSVITLCNTVNNLFLSCESNSNMPESTSSCNYVLFYTHLVHNRVPAEPSHGRFLLVEAAPSEASGYYEPEA